MIRVLCSFLLIVAVLITGCVDQEKSISDVDWTKLMVDSPDRGKPLLSDQLVERSNREIKNLEALLNIPKIEAYAQSDAQLRSLYLSYLGHKKQLEGLTRENSAVFVDNLQIISNLKFLEGYLNRDQHDFRGETVAAASLFELEIEKLEEHFLDLSKSCTTVEMAAFLMGAEHILTFSRSSGQSALQEVDQATPKTLFFLNEYPLILELLAARYEDLLQTASDVSKCSYTALNHKDVEAFREDLLHKVDELMKVEKPPEASLNGVLYSNLDVYGRLSKERGNHTYASLRLALHAVAAGRLMTLMNDVLGIVPIDMSSLSEEDLQKVVSWFGALSTNSYCRSLEAVKSRLSAADNARWPLARLAVAYELITKPDATDEFSTATSLIEAIISSELVASAVKLDSLVKVNAFTFSFENYSWNGGIKK